MDKIGAWDLRIIEKKPEGVAVQGKGGFACACVEEFRIPLAIAPGRLCRAHSWGNRPTRIFPVECLSAVSGQVGQVRFKDSISLDAKRSTVYCFFFYACSSTRISHCSDPCHCLSNMLQVPFHKCALIIVFTPPGNAVWNIGVPFLPTPSPSFSLWDPLRRSPLF